MNITIVRVWVLMVFGFVTALAKSETDWKNIQVEIKSNHVVTSTQVLAETPNGFKRLEIILSNQGREPLTIEKITVRIPLLKPMNDNTPTLYGSSCMDRTPLLCQTVGGQTHKSSSHMYEMVRLANDSYLFIGSLSWRVFLPNFNLNKNELQIWSNGEGKQLKPGQRIKYETIVLTCAASWRDLLKRYGTAIAVENNISKIKQTDYKGWATWDYYAKTFTAQDVYGNMDQLNQIAPESNLIQIDGGWWIRRGDYKSVRPNLLPGGIKAIASRSKAEGKTLGLHFDGFRADVSSEIYKTHPEYFLCDQDGKLIITEKEQSGSPVGVVFFDYSHPGARAYIADCIRNMKENWGVRYFKIDFMRYGLENDIKDACKNVRSIKAFDPTLTGVERFRLGLQTMRESIGTENYFLGCSAVFGPCIGFVDGMRTGGDINPRYEAFSERCLANLGNYYLVGPVFNADADYLVFREAADEDATVSKEAVKHGGSMTINEAQMWADFNKIYGSIRLSSDNLMTLRKERQSLVQEVFKYPVMDESIPLDVWQHAKHKKDGFELVLARKGNKIYLGVFNWSDQPKEYTLLAFGKKVPVRLAGRHSAVLKYEGEDSFDKLFQTLTP